MKKYLKNIIVVALILVALIVVILSTTDYKEVFKAIGNVKIGPMILALLMVVMYMGLLALSLHLIVRKKSDVKLKVMDSINIANSQHFYNGITPFQAGGQPLQFYYYNSKGMSKHRAASILVMNFVLYQLALSIISVIAMILYFGYLKSNVEGFMWAMLVGFVINTSILVGLILMGTSKAFKSLCVKLINLLSKIKFLKKILTNINLKMENFVETFQEGFKESFKDKFMLLGSLILKIISLIILFSMPYFAFLALGIEISITKICFIIGMSVFANVFMSYIPTPGASGGAEWAFKTVFITFDGITSISSVAGALIWRFFTYYLTIIIGFISVLFISRKKNNKIVEEINDDFIKPKEES